jgi:uncharacterized protein (DUF924 family)
MIGAKLVAHDEQDVADFAHGVLSSTLGRTVACIDEIVIPNEVRDLSRHRPKIPHYVRDDTKIPMTSSIRDILDFWFLPLGDPGHGQPREMWWQSTPELDAETRVRFAPLLDRAIAGALDGWMGSPDGALALILLCDQFPRNMYRRSARAFAGDAKAIGTARLALARFYPAAFPRDMRLFFYMPFQHSEALADQELCCALCAALGGEDSTKYAIAHRDIIVRFGRFPHRNEALGRASTAEELDYLRTADRFGQ